MRIVEQWIHFISYGILYSKQRVFRIPRNIEYKNAKATTQLTILLLLLLREFCKRIFCVISSENGKIMYVFEATSFQYKNTKSNNATYHLAVAAAERNQSRET